MKFLRRPKPEEKSRDIQADLSNILASLTMRLEQVERRLDAIEGAPGRPQVISLPPMPPEPFAPRPTEQKVEKTKAKGELKRAKPTPPRPRALAKRAERMKAREKKLEPAKLTRGKSVKPFKGED